MIEAFFGVMGVVACIGLVVGGLVFVAKHWVAFCDWKREVDCWIKTLDGRDVRLDMMDVRERLKKLEASDKLTDEAIGSLRNRQNAQDAAISRLERERMERVNG